MISFVTSDKATYSASVDDSVTLLLDFDFHAIGAPQKYTMYPNTLALHPIDITVDNHQPMMNHTVGGTTFHYVYNAAFGDGGGGGGSSSSTNPIQCSCLLCIFFMMYCFIRSTITKDYSQVDRLWSILPVVYSWIFIIDERTFLMACTSTIWGIRLTYNFIRKGGYAYPDIWNGIEDYRWSYLQKNNTNYLPILGQNKFIWMCFNLFFISIFQNILQGKPPHVPQF